MSNARWFFYPSCPPTRLDAANEREPAERGWGQPFRAGLFENIRIWRESEPPSFWTLWRKPGERPTFMYTTPSSSPASSHSMSRYRHAAATVDELKIKMTGLPNQCFQLLKNLPFVSISIEFQMRLRWNFIVFLQSRSNRVSAMGMNMRKRPN